MKNETFDRRAFLKTAAAAAALAQSSILAASAIPMRQPNGKWEDGLNLLRAPDHVSGRFGVKNVTRMQLTAHTWTCQGVQVSAEPTLENRQGELPVRVTNQGRDLTYIHLRWEGKQCESLLSIGDHWERSYGDLEWRGTIPERIMPWYFLTFDGERANGYGVKTQASAFCFWQRDTDGITLSIDLRNGGDATALGDRELHACTVVTRMGLRNETISHAGSEFCRAMCPTPRLPVDPLFGVNDWNYAYGGNTAAGILRDAELVSSLAPSGRARPYVVVDDGWQDPSRFPSMPRLAEQIRKRGAKPGLWVRPLRAAATTPPAWLLPDDRFGSNASHSNLTFDPTYPEALEEATNTVRTAVEWGYEFIKHDFTTYELFGRWGFEMRGQFALPGWHFHDRSRTNAEIVRDLSQGIRIAAGEGCTILGCNTVGHLAAGIFESQRIADDTSGREWERTRRFGVNGLAHRMAQHRTFSYIDPDCVAITANIGWRETSQWMDVVARSGTSLFVSPEPSAITPEIKGALRDAMELVAKGGSGFPLRPTQGATPTDWQFTRPAVDERKYDWCGPEGAAPFID